jgi:capsule polysaccharide export protein KpsE/RkpR
MGLARQDVAPVSTVQIEGPRTGNDHTVAMLRLIWAQRILLFRFVATGLVVSALTAFLIPKRYNSTARLMPPDDQSGSGLAMAAAAFSGRSGSALGGMVGDALGLKSTSDSFVGILDSRTAEDQLIQKFNLKKVYGARTTEDARKILSDQTNISVDRKSQIIAIEVTDKNPQRAAAMVQAYVDELNRLVVELSTSSARRERIFLEDRLRSVNQDLAKAEKEFSQFASKNTAIDVPAQGRAMVEAAAALQGELIAAQSELEGLKQIYSDQNVHVRSVAARVAELRDQLNQLGGKDEGTSGSSQSGRSMYPSIRKLPLLGVTYADLFRQTKVQEAVFETLTQEYELAKVQEAKEIPTVKILDPPDVPEKKSYPPRLIIILLVTVLALATGVTWIFAQALWDAKDPRDADKIFAQEVFGNITARLPWVSSNGSSVDLRRSQLPCNQKSSDEVQIDE